LQIRTSLSIALSLIFLGWVLTAYQTSLWGWLGTILCLHHLAKSGKGAIPIALAWATGILWIAAFDYAAPAGFLWRNAQYWAASLIFLWIFATSIILAMAKIPTLFQASGKPQRPIGLISSLLIPGCMGLGICCYWLGQALR
jgi:hypothetical protein